MEGRKRALMHASVSLQLLISVLKKHDLEAPQMLDEPLISELLSQLRSSLQEAACNEESTRVVDVLKRSVANDTLLKPDNLLVSLRELDAMLYKTEEKRAHLHVL